MSRKVPEGWWETTLGAFARAVSERNGGRNCFPVLSVTKYDGFVPSNEYFTKTVHSKDTENYKIVRNGQFAYATIHLDEGSIDYLSDFEAGIISPMYTVFEVDETRVDHRFLLPLLKLLATRGKFDALGNGGVNRRKSISFKILANFPINLPPLSEQRRIAEILSSVDEAIATAQAVVEQTRTVRQGVLKRLLTKGIGHTLFKQTEIGEIPEAWEPRHIGELCQLTNGNGFRPPDWSAQGLPIIRIQNLNGSRKFNYYSGVPKEKWIVEHGDLLFSWAGVRGVSFGPCLWTGPRGVLNQHIFKVHPSEGIRREWLLHAMELVTTRIEEKAHGFKDSLLHVHKSEITGQLVGVPNEEEQGKIVEALSSFSLAEAQSSNQLTCLINLRRTLASDLLSGRKRVLSKELADI